MAKKELESLVRAGAFDFLGEDRGALFDAIPGEIRRAKSWEETSSRGAWTLFGDTEGQTSVPPLDSYPQSAWNKQQIQNGEYDALGFYFSGHPLREQINKYALCTIHTVKSLPSLPDRTPVTIAGIIRQTKFLPIKTGKNKGRKRSLFVLEDISGRVECSMFADATEAYGQFVVDGQHSVIYGRISAREEILQIHVNTIETFDKCLSTLPVVRIVVDTERVSPEDLKNLLETHPGPIPVRIHSRSSKSEALFQTSCQVLLDDDFLSAAEALLGRGCLRRTPGIVTDISKVASWKR